MPFSYIELMLCVVAYPICYPHSPNGILGYSGAVLLGIFHKFYIQHRRGNTPNLLFSKLNCLLNSTRRKKEKRKKMTPWSTTLFALSILRSASAIDFPTPLPTAIQHMTSEPPKPTEGFQFHRRDDLETVTRVLTDAPVCGFFTDRIGPG